MADADLKRTLGTLRYLQGLKKARVEQQEQLPAAGAGSSQLRERPATPPGIQSHQQGSPSVQSPSTALQPVLAAEPTSTGRPWHLLPRNLVLVWQAFAAARQLQTLHSMLRVCAVPWVPEGCTPLHLGRHECVSACRH